MLERLIINLSNSLIRLRKVQVQANELLVLAPHCIQKSKCGLDVNSSIENCGGCGACRCGDLKTLCEKLGIKALVAHGGTEAIKAARDPQIKALIAIACPKELRAGIIATFPKPVLAVSNRQPNGPCKSTDVVFTEVEQAARQLLESSA